MNIKFKKVREVETPIYASEGAAAMDLFAATEGEYNQVGDYYEFKTGIALQIPQNYVGILAPRSSITNKRMMLGNSLGVIDEDFRGEVTVRLKAIEGTLNNYQKGERIAQLLIVPCIKAQLIKVDELDETVRGEGGYGSTDTKFKVLNEVCLDEVPYRTATVIGNSHYRDDDNSITHSFDIGTKVTIEEGPDEEGDYLVSHGEVTQYINPEHLEFD